MSGRKYNALFTRQTPQNKLCVKNTETQRPEWRALCKAAVTHRTVTAIPDSCFQDQGEWRYNTN